MKDKKCPKCSSDKIIHLPSGGQEYEPADITISKGWWGDSDLIKVSRYACGACGYMEFWVENPEVLKTAHANLREKGIGG